MRSPRTSCGPVALAALVIASTLSSSPAVAQGRTGAAAVQAPQARAAELFNKSADAYRRGDFQQAVTLLLEARSLDPQPVLLYNLARAYEGLGNVDAAIDTFTRYLDEDPKAADRGAIEQRISTLKRQRDERLTLEKQRDAERTRADEEKAARASSPRPAPHPAPRERSLGPYLVSGAGVAGIASGVVFGLLASSKHDGAASASTAQQAAIEQQDTAKTFATVSTVSFIAGGVLVAAGVTWWVIDGMAATKQGAGPATLRIGLAPGRLMLERGFP